MKPNRGSVMYIRFSFFVNIQLKYLLTASHNKQLRAQKKLFLSFQKNLLVDFWVDIISHKADRPLCWSFTTRTQLSWWTARLLLFQLQIECTLSSCSLEFKLPKMKLRPRRTLYRASHLVLGFSGAHNKHITNKWWVVPLSWFM